MPSEQGPGATGIKKLIEDLKSSDPEVRESAAEALAEAGDLTAVAALTEAAENDPSPGVKSSARKALAAVAGKTAAPKAEDDFLALAEDFLTSYSEGGQKGPQNAAAEPPAPPQPVPPAPKAAPPIAGVGHGTRARIDAIISAIINSDVSKLSGFQSALSSEKDPFVKATLLSAIGKLGNYSCFETVLPYLSDPDARVAANAIEAMENLGNPQAVEYLVRFLPHSGSRLRANAIKALLKLVDEGTATRDAIFEKLREMFNSDDPAMKFSAIYVLGEQKSEEAMEVLQDGLADADETVRARIEETLSRMQDEMADEKGRSEEIINRAIDKFNQVLTPDAAKGIDEETREEIDRIQDAASRSDGSGLDEYLKRLPGEKNPFLKATLVAAIGKLGGRDDWKVVAPLLRDQDSRVAANAVEALEKLDNPECIESLIKIISHPDNRVRANVFKAIWKFARADERACRLVMDRLRDMLLSIRVELRESAIYVLGEIASDEAEKIISAALEDKNAGVRAKAAAALEKVRKALAESGGEKADVPSTTSAAAEKKAEPPAGKPAEKKQHEAVPAAREEAKAPTASPEARAETPPPGGAAIEKAIEGLSIAAQVSQAPKEMDEATRAEVKRIQGVIAAADKSALPKFLATLASEQNPFIRATLIVAVGKLGSKQNMDALTPFLNDADVRVVANAVEALEALGNPKCVESLLTVMSHPDNRVRANVSKAIWKFAQTNVTACRLIIDRLKGMLFSSKPQMRESAIFALGEIASDESVELLNLALNDKSQEIRDKIGEAIAKAEKLRQERAKAASAAAAAAAQKSASKTAASAKSGRTQARQAPATQAAQAAAASAATEKGSPVLLALIITLSIICVAAGSFYGYWIAYRGSTFEEFAALVSGRTFTPEGPAKTIDTVEIAVRHQAPLTTAEIALRDQKRREAFKARMEELLKAQIDEGKEMFNEGYYTGAIAKFKKLMKRFPDNQEIKKYHLEAHFKRAEALFNLEIYSTAKVEYEKVISLDKKNGNLAFRSSGRLETIAKNLRKK